MDFAQSFHSCKCAFTEISLLATALSALQRAGEESKTPFFALKSVGAQDSAASEGSSPLMQMISVASSAHNKNMIILKSGREKALNIIESRQRLTRRMIAVGNKQKLSEISSESEDFLMHDPSARIHKEKMNSDRDLVFSFSTIKSGDCLGGSQFSDVLPLQTGRNELLNNVERLSRENLIHEIFVKLISECGGDCALAVQTAFLDDRTGHFLLDKLSILSLQNQKIVVPISGDIVLQIEWKNKRNHSSVSDSMWNSLANACLLNCALLTRNKSDSPILQSCIKFLCHFHDFKKMEDAFSRLGSQFSSQSRTIKITKNRPSIKLSPLIETAQSIKICACVEDHIIEAHLFGGYRLRSASQVVFTVDSTPDLKRILIGETMRLIIRPILYGLAGALGGICIDDDGCEFDIISDKDNATDDQRIATFVATILEQNGTSPKLAFSVKHIDSRAQQAILDFLKKRQDVSISDASILNSFVSKSKDSQLTSYFSLS